MAARDIKNRVFYISQRCHTISANVLDRSHLIMAQNYLILAQGANDDKMALRYIRMATIAYNRAVKDNALPSEKELKEVFGSDYEDVVKTGGL